MSVDLLDRSLRPDRIVARPAGRGLTLRPCPTIITTTTTINDNELDPMAARVRALETILTQKGLIDPGGGRRHRRDL